MILVSCPSVLNVTFSNVFYFFIFQGPSVQLVFGFEYAILLTIIINLIVKWVLHSIDLHSENPWENKAVFMLYTELFIGFIKVRLRVKLLFNIFIQFDLRMRELF